MEYPRVNFAISKRGIEPGVDHLGLQVESETELTELRGQVAAAEVAARPAEFGMLLCALRQVLDNRSARNRMGNLSFPGFDTCVR